MIQIIKGTYGLLVNGVVEAITKDSKPITLSKKREAELVEMGVAVKVDESEAYTDMDVEELRKVAAEKGIDLAGAKSKKKILAMLTAVEESSTLAAEEAEE